MPAKQSAIVDKALAMIGKPKKGGGSYCPAEAARKYGLALSTIYRAQKRAIERNKGEA